MDSRDADYAEMPERCYESFCRQRQHDDAADAA